MSSEKNNLRSFIIDRPFLDYDDDATQVRSNGIICDILSGIKQLSNTFDPNNQDYRQMNDDVQ